MDKNYALSLPLANDFNAYVNAALKNNEIGKNEWYEINKVYFTKMYLAQNNPRGQSGHGGDAFHYAYSHLPIVEAIYKNGTFLDVGCANGHLCEMVHQWAAAVGFDLQMYGVDISEGLIELAKERLPQWSEHFYIGNSFFWKTEQKFDYIHVGGLGQVPEDDEIMFFKHIMEEYLADGGKLILGPSWCDNDDSRYKGIQKLLDSGITPNGYIEKTHYKNPNRVRRAVWFDKGSMK
ncbi:MAG TPA: methyltransferase domain-containing protein [Oscillospiraceae bacterium]|nr:methyltransferase domain-containing protein [Oscillospiraceae bacterium]HPK34176.1 methyltransferase domain-containing protein [Oscillospiraceae bacterium]HPR74921.1 methyltransferase domain-containing protein [Oscillospiraceae bacterium]